MGSDGKGRGRHGEVTLAIDNCRPGVDSVGVELDCCARLPSPLNGGNRRALIERGAGDHRRSRQGDGDRHVVGVHDIRFARNVGLRCVERVFSHSQTRSVDSPRATDLHNGRAHKDVVLVPHFNDGARGSRSFDLGDIDLECGGIPFWWHNDGNRTGRDLIRLGIAWVGKSDRDRMGTGAHLDCRNQGHSAILSDCTSANEFPVRVEIGYRSVGGVGAASLDTNDVVEDHGGIDDDGVFGAQNGNVDVRTALGVGDKREERDEALRVL